MHQQMRNEFQCGRISGKRVKLIVAAPHIFTSNTLFSRHYREL
jgi:hypothetical protein